MRKTQIQIVGSIAGESEMTNIFKETHRVLDFGNRLLTHDLTEDNDLCSIYAASCFAD